MADDADALRAFKSMHRVLAPGGIAVLDQGITDRRWAAKQRFSLTRSSQDRSRVYVVDYTGERDCQYHVLDVSRSDLLDQLLERAPLPRLVCKRRYQAAIRLGARDVGHVDVPRRVDSDSMR